MRRRWQEGKWVPKDTEAGRRRQQKSEWYAWQASSSGGVSPQEVESIPHMMEIPWPYSFSQMGKDFMQKWTEEGNERGFNLRLAG